MKPTWFPDESRAGAYRASGAWEQRSLGELLGEAAAVHGDRIALSAGRQRLSFADLDRQARRLAAALQSAGVGPGDVVSFQLPNRVEAAVVFWATMLVGAVANPIVPIYRQRELGFILAQAQTRVAFIPGTYRGTDFPAMYVELARALPGLDAVVVVDDTPADGTQTLAAFMGSVGKVEATPVQQDPDDIVLLLFTSGTTAEPKGVLHSSNTVIYDMRQQVGFFGLNANDIIFNPAPVTHVTGTLWALIAPVFIGSAAVLQESWDPDEAWSLIREHRASFMMFATPFVRGLLRSGALPPVPPDHIRYVACGGADIQPGLIREATERIGTTIRLYGATEGPSATACNVGDPVWARAESDGRPLAPTELQIVREDGSTCEPGELGEVLWRGPDTCLGYLDASLNDRAFTPGGFFRTGDLGRIDETGYLHIGGRIKDIINRSGEKFSAFEIEQLLAAHDAVREVAVVAAPDPATGERACAYVVFTDGLQIDLGEVGTFLRDSGVAAQKLPERLVVLEALPKTVSGKIQKNVLREWAADGDIAAAGVLLRQDR
jgi:cyclohexanecarboxylate-CoA ligase